LAESDLELLAQANAGYQRLKSEVAKVIVGQQDIVRPALASIFSAGHSLVIGVPGLAKTLLVRTLAEILGWEFRRIQFTPDLMPSDIVGMELLQEDPQTGSRRMQFVKGPVFANLVLADEINRTPPKTQSALLEAMQEYTVTSMGQTYPLASPFIVFATQNPIEQEGTYPLPEAQLDRFMFSLWANYPDADEEEEIVMATTRDFTPQVAPVFSVERMLAFQHLVRRIPVARHVVRYAVALARSTRPENPGAPAFVKNYVSWGAGPRAAQNMILAAKSLAVLEGQPAAACRLVRESARWVLRHRVLPNYNAAGDGIDAAMIVDKLLENVPETADIEP